MKRYMYNIFNLDLQEITTNGIVSGKKLLISH